MVDNALRETGAAFNHADSAAVTGLDLRVSGAVRSHAVLLGIRRLPPTRLTQFGLDSAEYVTQRSSVLTKAVVLQWDRLVN